MTNYKTFKIATKMISQDIAADDYIRFTLDSYVQYKNKRVYNYIDCRKTSPFTEYREGDYLEIDLEAVEYYDCQHSFNDTNIVRRVSSSAVVSGSSGQMSLSREQAEVFADRLADRVEKSGGQYELDAYIQQGTEPHGTPYTRQGWVYRKK